MQLEDQQIMLLRIQTRQRDHYRCGIDLPPQLFSYRILRSAEVGHRQIAAVAVVEIAGALEILEHAHVVVALLKAVCDKHTDGIALRHTCSVLCWPRRLYRERRRVRETAGLQHPLCHRNRTGVPPTPA